MPTSGAPLAWCTASQSGWCVVTSASGEARKGASQIPGVRPAASIEVASSSSGAGKVPLVDSQSPIAAWKPSSTWNTSNDQSLASARLARTSASVTAWK